MQYIKTQIDASFYCQATSYSRSGPIYTLSLQNSREPLGCSPRVILDVKHEAGVKPEKLDAVRMPKQDVAVRTIRQLYRDVDPLDGFGQRLKANLGGKHV